MLTIRFIIRFFDKRFVLKTLFILLLISLLPLAEIVLLFYLGDYIGNYLILSVVAVTGLLGVFVIFSEAGKSIDKIMEKVREGYYPSDEFAAFAGILLCGVLLVSPGFITDCLGILFLLPTFRRPVGTIITTRMPARLKELYEYLKLYE